MEFNSEAFEGVADHILDTLGREFTANVLARILKQIRDKEIINKVDKNGFALIHYFTLVNFHESIKLLSDFGADLNILANDGSYPLLIAASRGHETSV